MKKQKKKGRGGNPAARGKQRKKPQRQRPAAARVVAAAPTLRRTERPKSGRVVSLEPLMPVIVRSARPMEGKSDADPARFPPPSTVAGCLRTAWARAERRPFGRELAERAVAGPLLLTADRRVLAPRPADALYFGSGEEACCIRSEPRAFDPGVGTDLPDGLLPVRLTEDVKGKPGEGPSWWDWKDLLAFRRGDDVEHSRLSENGWLQPPGDRRTHVTIEPGTRAARDGQLFQTEGLDFDVGPARYDESSQDRKRRSGPGGLRLLARFAEPMGKSLVHLGGKRRLAALQPEAESIWPKAPEDWLERIREAGGLSLTLLTPGIFSAGWRPGWVDAGGPSGSPPVAPNLKLRLRAAAVSRWQPHSGWDLAGNKPRPTRKLAGAGATYWFQVIDGLDAAALDALWLAGICDDEQDRRDGFGLALPAPWTPPERGA